MKKALSSLKKSKAFEKEVEKLKHIEKSSHYISTKY